MNLKRRTAKNLYWVSGQLCRIKTYSKMYEWVVTDDDDVTDLNFRYIGRKWISWHFSFTVMRWSERLDPKHWDHWALVHDETCEWCTCAVCSGTICIQEANR